MSMIALLDLRLSILGKMYRVMYAYEFTFTFIIRIVSAIVASPILAILQTPTLFTKMLIYLSWMAWFSFDSKIATLSAVASDSKSNTTILVKTIPLNATCNSFATSLSFASLRPTRIIWKFSLANWNAYYLPMPSEAPVTIAQPFPYRVKRSFLGSKKYLVKPEIAVQRAEPTVISPIQANGKAAR